MHMHIHSMYICLISFTYYTILYYVISYHIWYHIILYYIMLYYITLNYFILCYILYYKIVYIYLYCIIVLICSYNHMVHNPHECDLSSCHKSCLPQKEPLVQWRLVSQCGSQPAPSDFSAIHNVESRASRKRSFSA